MVIVAHGVADHSNIKIFFGIRALCRVPFFIHKFNF
nr:MAG TPA: hypothetical protein [Caudoviricetes sp.]